MHVLFFKGQPNYLLCQKLHLLLIDLSVAEGQHDFLVLVMKATMLFLFRHSQLKHFKYLFRDCVLEI